MALRSVPPTGSYTATGRKQREFAALYEQARRHSGNDNGGNNRGGTNSGDRGGHDADKAAEERQSLENLHNRVDTLRGEILVRVMQAASTDRYEDSARMTGEITRMSRSLDTLRKKLHQEEERLSGKLIDVEA
ncbi:MAG: hypothetical protein H6865_03795 [Rhodospirillales bacterium]|nr:hypothetical protein [Alphaproteobacteria bacterium]MCB9986740.1 hypothetical protein [Rhodospirillales bacterium]USO08492.1 MAG: hypothetical protein H6866_04595 [Rhodospirillales bacterium]